MELAIEGENATRQSCHDEQEGHEQPGVAMHQAPEAAGREPPFLT